MMGVIWLCLTFAFLAIDDWNRAAFMKGMVGWGVIFMISNYYPKFKSYYANYKKQQNIKMKYQINKNV